MYWLIGSLLLVAMMGVLTVAESMAISINPFLADILSTPVLFILLITLAITLSLVTQSHVPSINPHNRAQPISYDLPHHFKPSFRIVTYVLVTTLAIGLIVGSAMQAMVSHQQAKSTEITEPMRVQALVTVEGISDSVYDGTTDSGYRQVVTISHIAPLVSELTTQDLDDITRNYLTSNKNSLSNNLNAANSDNTTYRVLLNAYPKKPSKSSAGKPSNDAQLTRLNQLQPGDQLFMSLTLATLSKSEQATNNPSGFDSHRWLRGRHIDGLANVLVSSTSIINPTKVNHANSSVIAPSSDSYLKRFRTRIDQGRWRLRQHFYKNWEGQTTAEQQAKAVTLSLLTGDRSLINRETKDLYQLAGISHLLAISGTHILFLTVMLSGAVVLLFDRRCPLVYRSVPRWQIRWWVMIGAAFIYALFTGFDVPAARTAWMLLAVGLVRLTLLPVSTIKVLFALAVLMAWHDPYVLWQAGYWLSFIAVALLLKYEDASYKHGPPVFTQDASAMNTLFTRIWITGKRLFKLQFWLFLTLLPVTLLLFGKASLWGLIINLFAIGLFGWVIVPLNLLAGLCYLISPAIADNIWSLVIGIVTGLHELIIALTSLPALSKAWLYTPVNMALVLMVLLSLLPWLLSRGFISRWLALPPLTLLMMTVYANQQSLATIPTLYVLPTGDPYISAALLQYPIVDNKGAADTNKKNVSWLFLADNRSTTTQSLPSRLTASQLSTTLEQQLGRLSIDRLEGVIVQSGDKKATLTKDNKQAFSNNSTAALLPMSVAHLSGRLPISQYWQAGRSDHKADIAQAYQANNPTKRKSSISAQRCEQGKTWQLATGGLSIKAMTGWSQINDASVWDCSVAIDSGLPVRVLRYDASEPLRSLLVTTQKLISKNSPTDSQADDLSSRLILNTDTHPRIWQMWSLLCKDELSNDVLACEKTIPNHTTWLGHSASHITTNVMSDQDIDEVVTYDDKGLEAALSLTVAAHNTSQK